MKIQRKRLQDLLYCQQLVKFQYLKKKKVKTITKKF